MLYEDRPIKNGWLLVLALATICLAIAPPTRAATPPQVAQKADLKKTLIGGLRVARPQDTAWTCMVVKKVEDGQLPLALVLSTFQWARKQRTSYPFFYFKRGLRERAARIGILL